MNSNHSAANRAATHDADAHVDHPPSNGDLRSIDRPLEARPVPIQLLANGRLATMVSATGAGYVHFEACAVTRWRPDRTSDAGGYGVYLRDLESDLRWSLGFQPTCQAPERYAVRVSAGRLFLDRLDWGVAARMEVCVHDEFDFDLRRCTLTNNSLETRTIELTSYAELALHDALADLAHPAFSKLFVETGRTEAGLLVARRRPRRADEKTLSACHFLVDEDQLCSPIEFETDRSQFLGRGGSLRRPAALLSADSLAGKLGSVLDPIFCLRTTLVLPPGASSSVTFGLGAGYSLPRLSAAAEAIMNPAAIDDAFRRADKAACETYRQMSTPIDALPELRAIAARRLYGYADEFAGDAHARADADADANGNADAQSFLAYHRIHERRLWAAERLANSPANSGPAEADASMRLAGATRARQSASQTSDACSPASPAPGSLDAESLNLGPVSPAEPLIQDNGIGGFARHGREYALRIAPTSQGALKLPPLAWNNVVSNASAGFMASETGAGCTWAANSRTNRLTPWHNDLVADPVSEAVYLRDEETGEFWSMTPRPAPQRSTYEVRHGWGYTVYRHAYGTLNQEATLFVPVEDPVKITRIRLVNAGPRVRRMKMYVYAQWELGPGDVYGSYGTQTSVCAERHAVLATNSRRDEFADREAFCAFRGPGNSCRFTADRTEFLGWNGDLSRPQSVVEGKPLSGAAGVDLDPCAAIEIELALEPGEAWQCALLLGETPCRDDSLRLIDKYADASTVDEALRDVRAFWEQTLSAVQIETPSPALDLMVNGWLPYQNMSCRFWGRSSAYQSGGAYGFRDQLQDAAALIYHRPDLTRRQILRNAAHQFVEGDVLHWWHPPLSRGMRTRFSDDLLWLPLVACEYVAATGDGALWREQIGFLTGDQVPPGEAELFLTPRDSGHSGTLYDHCCRALDRGLTRGANGLPLMGCGDWNDGMNRVGQGGTGESVWLGFFIDYILERMAPVCRAWGDRPRVDRYAAYREQLRLALNDAGWDGKWYRRAFFDDGVPLGTAAADECRIDALVQAWAVLSKAAPPDRAALAIAEADRRLVDEQAGIIRLLDPPFDKMAHDPGYIKGYVPGVRENGGQYTHGVLWLIRAMAELGYGTRACRLLEMISPVSRTATAQQAAVYQAEPYVVAADVYGQLPHAGRAGWSWYTGSAGWMFRVAVESILGIRLERGEHIRINPCISIEWPEFRLRYRLPDGSTHYHIRVSNPHGRERGVQAATFDGGDQPVADGQVIVPLVSDGKDHIVEVFL